MTDEIEVVLRRRYKRVRRELTPRILAALEDRPLMERDFAVAVNVTQNVLKDCLSITFGEAVPQSRLFFAELATRLACYVITCVEPDYQEEVAMAVRAGLLPKLADMQAAGNVIETEWE